MIRLFLADADLKRAIVDGVLRREQSIDFKLAERVPLEGLPDLEVLAIAALEQRVLVTYYVSTMPIHIEEFVSLRNSPGVVIAPQHLPVGQVIEALLFIVNVANPADLENRICLLPSFVTYGF